MNNVEHKPSVLMLYTILREETNEEHKLSTNQLIARIEERYGLHVHRTTIAGDVEMLKEYGADIVVTRSRQNLYHLAYRRFELTELKLLVDAVHSSRIITEKKSEELVQKLATLTDVSHAKELSRVLITDSRVKATNEKVYYIMDALYDAIRLGRKTSFLYYDYGPDKLPRAKNDGNPYLFSPYALLWMDDFYYVVGYSDKHGNIGAFRVDRIGYPVTVLGEEAVPCPEDFRPEDYYGNHVFQMYKGTDSVVVLRCANEIMKSVIDRFGERVETWISDAEHFSVRVEMSVSQTFFAWVFTFGEKMKIVGPPAVREQFLGHLRKVAALYGSADADDAEAEPPETIPAEDKPAGEAPAEDEPAEDIPVPAETDGTPEDQ